MNRYLFLLYVLIGVTDIVHAQKVSPKGRWGFKVRQSFESTDLKAEPAALLLTFPYQTAASYAVDGGLAIEREAPTNRFFGKLVAEYHRNTLIDEEQNNGQIGLAFEKYSGNFKTILNGTAKYVRDVVATKGSFLHTLELSAFPDVANGTIHRIKGDNANLLLILPSIGYEYQNVFDAKAEKRDSLCGNILRVMGKAKISLTLNKRVKVVEPDEVNTILFEDSSGIKVPTKKRLFEINSAQSVVVPAVILSANGAMRYDVVNTTKTPDGWHPYLQAGIDYILTRNKKLEQQLSVGLSFTTGENPAQGLARQKYWLLAVKFTL